LIVCGDRRWYLFELQNIRRAVTGVDDRFHGYVAIGTSAWTAKP
jgi:hypothetical protein